MRGKYKQTAFPYKPAESLPGYDRAAFASPFQRMRLASFCLVVLAAGTAFAGPERKENERGVVGYDETERLPWINFRKHDHSRPLPPAVEGKVVVSAAPSDAVVLFDGVGLGAWKPGKWRVEDGVLVAGEGDLETVQAFGSCQIHLEFMVPAKPAHDLYDRGNSGVFPSSHYEIQIFDSHPMHRSQIYPDGQCAAIYGETPPRVNACAKPGEWQSFDLIFVAPTFQDGAVKTPARVTLLHNGVVVHLDQEVHGRTGHIDLSSYSPHAPEMPLKLQGHGSSVKFRNVWVRRLP